MAVVVDNGTDNRYIASAYEDFGTSNSFLNIKGDRKIYGGSSSATSIITFDGGDSSAAHTETLDGGQS